MPKNSRTNLERMQSTGSMNYSNIPIELHTSPGTAFSVSSRERKIYTDAYKNAKTTIKRRHIAKHLRRKTERRAERKRGTRRSPVLDTVYGQNSLLHYISPVLTSQQLLELGSKQRRGVGANTLRYLSAANGRYRKL